MSDSDFSLEGYDDLELSTQIVIRDALNRGIEVSVLDRKSNFLKLEMDSKIEYVKQATKTSKDSYVTFLILENKSVCKHMLQEKGLVVPEGMTFDNPKDALRYCESTPWNTLVIKPATTDFGIGITIANARTVHSTLETGIREALSLSETLIVEEFVEGDEFRFLVVDSNVIAVCQRIPANVLGDGTSSVEDLVAEKNRDPRRGKGHVTPLEKIDLSATELGVLQANYEYDPSSIPAEGEIVFLRRNSNISTGGDSIDAGDRVDDFYKQVAEQAARCVNASICGVDLILPRPAARGDYSILEVNFNPVLYIHNYPYEGENRQVGERVLDLIGF
ncbi:MAG: carboxylate--amine ligase [Candidatus Hydrogenedentota bacterium]